VLASRSTVAVYSGFTVPCTWPVAVAPNGVLELAPKPVLAAGVEPKTPPVVGAVLPNALVVAGRDPNRPPLVALFAAAPKAGVAVEVPRN
jgi:hypothetical protein